MDVTEGTVEHWTPDWGARFTEVLKKVGGLKGAAALINVKAEQIAKWRDGKTRPPFFALQTLTTAAGRSLDWLANGDAAEVRVIVSSAPIDDELFGRVVDAVQRLYKEERVSLAPIDLGRIAGRKYGEIVAATEDQQERLSMIKLVVAQLRADIRSAESEPGTGKASA